MRMAGRRSTPESLKDGSPPASWPGVMALRGAVRLPAGGRVPGGLRPPPARLPAGRPHSLTFSPTCDPKSTWNVVDRSQVAGKVKEFGHLPVQPGSRSSAGLAPPADAPQPALE